MCDDADLFLHKLKDGMQQWVYYHTIHEQRCKMGFGVTRCFFKIYKTLPLSNFRYMTIRYHFFLHLFFHLQNYRFVVLIANNRKKSSILYKFVYFNYLIQWSA